MCSTTASCSGSGHIRQRSSGQRAARDSRRPAAAGARRRDPVAHDVASTRACLRATPARRRAILLRPRREAEVSSCGTARHSVPAGELCRPETCARLAASPTSTNSRRSSRSGRDGHLQRGRRPLRPGKLVDHRIAQAAGTPTLSASHPLQVPPAIAACAIGRVAFTVLPPSILVGSPRMPPAAAEGTEGPPSSGFMSYWKPR
jgi:hypothetical protein